MPKQKVHFHKFMLSVHEQMHQAKMVDKVRGDPLPNVVDRIIRSGKIICFDEFQVTDVADALILRRLFTGLWDRGAVVVTTSNRPPRDLYLNGIQRDLFIPFIDKLETKLEVVSMWESETDYRLVQGMNKARGVFFVGGESKHDFEDTFRELTKRRQARSIILFTQGREVKVPVAETETGVARFNFDQLCRKATGAADYLAVGEHFHTVFLDNVPKLTLNDVNILRRFITFVDTMYECHVKLVIHSQVDVNEIFEVDLENKAFDEAFAFDRTRSRLEEMGSDDYLRKKWVGKSHKVIDEVFSNDDVLLLDLGRKKTKK